jgi:hypothetical protein
MGETMTCEGRLPSAGDAGENDTRARRSRGPKMPMISGSVCMYIEATSDE